MAKDNQPTLLDSVKTLPWWEHARRPRAGQRRPRPLRNGAPSEYCPPPPTWTSPTPSRCSSIERTVVDTVIRRKKNGRTKTKKRTSYVRAYGVTSLTPQQAGPTVRVPKTTSALVTAVWPR